MKIIPLLSSIGIGMYGKWRLQKLLSKIILVAALVMMLATMAGMLVAFGFFEAYRGLLHIGVGSPEAVLLMISLVLATFFACAALTQRHIRSLRQMTGPRTPEIVDEACNAFDAFIDGLLSGQNCQN